MDKLRQLQERLRLAKEIFYETRQVDDFRVVQQLQLRHRLENPWNCRDYSTTHDLVPATDPKDPIYTEMGIDPTKTTLHVCQHCGGIRRVHKQVFNFTFIDRRS
jgi:hypothetical protein